MALHLVNFATAEFEPSRQELNASATRFGVDRVWSYSPADIAGDPFVRKHRTIFSLRRGYGYWLWKPYLVLRVLEQLSLGDALVYADAGSTVVSPLAPLEGLARDRQIVLFQNHGRLNRHWTKRDAFVLAGCDDPRYYDTEQVNAAFACYAAGPESIEFVREWLAACEDPRRLTDRPSECGLPELPEFLEHRHDQSVLSLLAATRGVTPLRDPSQLGNHLKPDRHRRPNERIELPYAREPFEGSDYPTIFDLHKRRCAEPVKAGAVRRVATRVRQSWRRLRAAPPAQRPWYDQRTMERVVRANRAALAKVNEWVSDRAYQASQFHYGLPPAVRSLINLPIGPEPTHADLLRYLCESLQKEPKYLEIGVSVGKTLFQIADTLPRGTMHCVDIEDPNPTLDLHLQCLGRTEFSASPASMKRGANSQTEYVHPTSGIRLTYLSGDLFDTTVWDRLSGHQFNVILSDALHWPEGLLHEWNMLRRHRLLDDEEFVILFDDLWPGGMTIAFNKIATAAKNEFGAERIACTVLHTRGWLGEHEPHHPIGIIASSSKIRRELIG